MSTQTTIEWTDTTWNPTIGCDRVSPGCRSCYAIPTARIRANNPHPKIAAAFEGTTDRIGGRLDWTGRVNLLEDRLADPLRWRKPRRVFVNSMSDLFHKDVPDEFIARVFAVMASTPQHTYQCLTKRHGRMRALLSDPAFEAMVDRALLEVPALADRKRTGRSWPLPRSSWPLPNVHLGVSVEDQQWADLRVPALLDTPAAVRFLSCEPLLGPVDLGAALLRPYERQQGGYWTYGPDADVHGGGREWVSSPGIDWVIAGGESGAGARPMHPDWARSLRDQAVAAGVPFLFKQWGAWVERPSPPGGKAPVWGGDLVTYVHPVDGRTQSHGDWARDREQGWACMQRVGKWRAGRLLDGRTWDEFPAVAS